MKILPIIIVFLLLLVTAASPRQASAVELEDRIESCAQMVSRISRLVCYDDLAKSLGFIPPEQAGREEQILEKYGFWLVTKRRNAAGEEIIYLKNDSVEEVVTKAGIQRNPTLVIQCKSGQTDVYLDWKAQLISEGFGIHLNLPISLQLDAEGRYTAYWELSTDRAALFAPDPVEFVKSMRKHDRLIIYLAPPSDRAQTIVHDISGLNVVLELLVQQCYN